MSIFAGFGPIEGEGADGEEEAESSPTQGQSPKKQEIVHAKVEPAPASALRNLTPCRTALRASYNVPAAALTQSMRTELTLTPRTSDDRKPESYEAFGVRGAVATVPRFWGLTVFGPPKDCRLARGEPADDLAFRGTLMPYQEGALASILPRYRDETNPAGAGAMLVAGCGTGKTVMAIAAACRFGRRTAILCHNSMLVTQWGERVEQFTGVVPGIVQRDRVEVGPDYPIVIFMINSVVSGRYDDEAERVFGSFGLVIVDECHHIAAKTFMESLRRFPAHARLGLTATPERRDGLGHAVEWLLGPVVYRVRRLAGAVQVRILRHERGPVRELLRYGKPDYVRMVTRSVDDEERTEAICRIVRALVEEGRYVIVLSDRRSHLAAMHERLGSELSGVYAGETTKRGKRAREGSKEKQVMLATTKMGEEGLDVPILSAIVLATPKSGLGGIEQAIGRVLRSHPEKKHTPLVVDVWDPVPIFQGMMRKRDRYYREQGY